MGERQGSKTPQGLTMRPEITIEIVQRLRSRAVELDACRLKPAREIELTIVNARTGRVLDCASITGLASLKKLTQQHRLGCSFILRARFDRSAYLSACEDLNGNGRPPLIFPRFRQSPLSVRTRGNDQADV